jgi:hypothetical protein
MADTVVEQSQRNFVGIFYSHLLHKAARLYKDLIASHSLFNLSSFAPRCNKLNVMTPYSQVYVISSMLMCTSSYIPSQQADESKALRSLADFTQS